MNGQVIARRPAPALLVVLALVIGLGPGCSDGGRPDLGVLGPGQRLPSGMRLSSTAFDDGGAIPERFSCEGENVPPPMRWEGVPAGTAELALVIEDPDAPDEIFVHWLVVGIEPGARDVGPAGPPPGATVLPGSSDNPTYIGPCPPDGDGPHRYVFQVYALPRPPVLAGGASPGDAVDAVREAATAGGVLLGTFQR